MMDELKQRRDRKARDEVANAMRTLANEVEADLARRATRTWSVFGGATATSPTSDGEAVKKARAIQVPWSDEEED
jgi:hypothetical protein